MSVSHSPSSNSHSDNNEQIGSTDHSSSSSEEEEDEEDSPELPIPNSAPASLPDSLPPNSTPNSLPPNPDSVPPNPDSVAPNPDSVSANPDSVAPNPDSTEVPPNPPLALAPAADDADNSYNEEEEEEEEEDSPEPPIPADPQPVDIPTDQEASTTMPIITTANLPEPEPQTDSIATDPDASVTMPAAAPIAPPLPEVAEACEEEELAEIITPDKGNEEDDSQLPSSEEFKFVSTADSLLRMINKFRESLRKPPLVEDRDLFRVAMRYSRQMAIGKEPCDTKSLGLKMRELPITHWFATVGYQNAQLDAFTATVNDLTTDRKKATALSQPFNVSGIGVSASNEGNAFFTIILGYRSIVGYSYYSGKSLRSVMLAERCSKIVNHVRHKEFRLDFVLLDVQLCELAHRFVSMDTSILTEEFVRHEIGICSDFKITFGRVSAKNVSPVQIVENWMNLCGRTKSILGDFNRFGCGFALSESGNELYSVCLYVRSMQAAVIDGKETVVEDNSIASRIADIMNEFRDQYGLPILTIDNDLCTVARKHAESIVNESEEDLLATDLFAQSVLKKYVAHDVSHMSCREIKRVPQTFMEKWRNKEECLSVILNQVDEIGVGVCFNHLYECHVTVIIGSFGNDAAVTNVHYTF
jgi:uncharacterized protein YkwD